MEEDDFVYRCEAFKAVSEELVLIMYTDDRTDCGHGCAHEGYVLIRCGACYS